MLAFIAICCLKCVSGKNLLPKKPGSCEEAMRNEENGPEPSSCLANLKQILSSIDRPGDYCAFGKTCASLPALRVSGMDALSFPISGNQIKTLIDLSRRSPFGKGPNTLVDQKVRDSWEMDPSEFSLEGAGWSETFASILGTAADGLGCPIQRLGANLYKLLIYEQGGFFLPHRDTEKTEGMVATLVVALPVVGSGGEIVVRHKGHETVIEMQGGEPSEISWAAFYSDCEHEVRPVLDGNRVVLVYSLVLSSGTGELSAPDFREQTRRVANELSAWRSESRDSDKIIWLLDHDYSETGLSFDSLKNVDEAVAGVLVEASESAGCSLYAAIVTVGRFMGSGEMPFDLDGEYDYGDASEPYETGEIFCVLEYLVAPDGKVADFGNISFSREEVLQTEMLEDLCHENEHNEHREGVIDVPPATMEFTHCVAALVLWPGEIPSS